MQKRIQSFYYIADSKLLIRHASLMLNVGFNHLKASK